jgi:3-oxoacyl-[acyl-carrier-protein] synthase-3
MYINGIGHYIPPRIVPNSFFSERCNVSDLWIEERCGVVERHRCAEHENTNTMGIAAVRDLLRQVDEPPYDLIIGATYTPYDTVVTLAHSIQHSLGIDDVPTMTVTTACSSVLNAFEIVEGYFATGKASRALIVGSEQNSAYLDEQDAQSGPLWGDAAVAFDVSKSSAQESCLDVKYLHTGGAATISKATTAVYLRPNGSGIPMVHGADVFSNACAYMEREARRALDLMNWAISDIAYFVPHQANLRISLRVAKSLGLPKEKLVSNVERYGNTGCCGFGIGLAQTLPNIKEADKVIAVVFGGGYSYGCMLLEGL